MIAAFAFLVTLTVLTFVGAGCYGLYQLECRLSGERPVNWFGWWK
jgi:hypothetical protein